MKILISIFILLFSFNCFGIENIDTFYISLRSDEVNLRTGPGNEYPIKFVYQLKDMPIKVLGEYDNWYKIQDKDGDEGWMNKNLTTKRKTLIVIGGTQLIYKKNNIKSNPIFRVEENVILKMQKCDNEWCKVEVNGKNGWIEAKNVWGHKL